MQTEATVPTVAKTSDQIPTVKTQKPANNGDQSSTSQESAPTFRIIPPSKKP
jgi:hypothetical protein